MKKEAKNEEVQPLRKHQELAESLAYAVQMHYADVFLQEEFDMDLVHLLEEVLIANPGHMVA